MREYHRNLHQAALKTDIFLNRIFTTIEVTAPALSSSELASGPIMIVSSHRSHLDYIIIGVMLDKLGIINLRFAAGDNLTNMPYVGKKFRSWGAFSVYRSQATKRSYIAKLAHQVKDMLHSGDNIIVFPEGGRSYSGKMLEMKAGVVASAIFTQYENPQKNVFFLPIAISYEKLPEIHYFSMLKRGKATLKDNPNFFQKLMGTLFYFGADLIAFGLLMLAPWIRRKYGKLYVDIGTPTPLSAITDVSGNFDPTMKSEFSAHKKSMEDSTVFIKNRITALFRILPMHLLAAILKETSTISKNEAALLVGRKRTLLSSNDHNLATINNLSDLDVVNLGIRQLKYTRCVKSSFGTIKICNKTYIDYYASALE